MEINEERLSKDAKTVLVILRKEMAEGRISQDSIDFLESAVKIKESMGVLGGFAVKFAGFVIAIGVIYSQFGGFLKGLFVK